MDYTTGVCPLPQVHKPPFTVEVPGVEKVPGETIPRRHPRAVNGLIKQPVDDVNTVYDIITRSARIYPNHQAVGSRKLVKLHKETKKVTKNVDGQPKEVDKEWTYFELSPYTFITYKEYLQRVTQLASGLRHLGLDSSDRVHFYATTSAGWISMSHACASQSISIVTAYDTLGAEGVKHTLSETKCAAMYVDPHLLKTAAKALKDSTVKTIIVNTDCVFAAGGEVEEFKSAHPEYNVMTYEDLRKLGQEHPAEPVPPKPSDVYCIMYTSGSTGLPKGACITHENLLAGVTGLWIVVSEVVSDKDFILAYLPLAHIFEMAVENIVLFIGATLGYGNPRTLSDTSMKNSAGDMREFRPTGLVGVPQVWETVRKGVVSKLDSSSPLLRSLFWGAFNFKSFMYTHKLPGGGIFDGIVFKKVRELTGGRLRFTMNGASGISPGTKHFLSLVLAPMLAGYGLTETCAAGSLGCPLEYNQNAIGPMPPCVEAKLVSQPELGYSADADKPQGEIWLRGPNIMKEYFNNPEETNKAKTEDGWFKTGDIGEFDDNGHLRVIDRVKNLVKMQGGEYIALEKLETVYRGSQSVANVLIYADPEYSRPIAVIMPNEVVLAEKAKSVGVAESDMHTNRKVVDLVLKELQATARSAGLVSMETVTGVVITDQEWTPDSGLVTATSKLNRKAIHSAFKSQIDEVLKTAS